MRSGSKWFSDEVHGNKAVTDDFFKYYGISSFKPVEEKKEEKQTITVTVEIGGDTYKGTLSKV